MKPVRASVVRPWQPRFGLGSLMLVVLVCCVTAAAGRHLVRALSSGVAGRATFVLFVLTVPVFLLLVVSGLRLIAQWIQQRRGS